MPEVSHGFEGFLLIFLLDVTGGECLLYKKLIFLRNNSKDKSESFLYIYLYIFIYCIPVYFTKICQETVLIKFSDVLEFFFSICFKICCLVPNDQVLSQMIRDRSSYVSCYNF